MTDDNPDFDGIAAELTKVDVAEIRAPEDAANDRENPEVVVAVHQMGQVRERYLFEFVRPPEDEDYPRYRVGPYGKTDGATESKHRNKAAFEAAKALAEHTNTPVETSVHPTEELEKREAATDTEDERL